jgi:hypothetical protein
MKSLQKSLIVAAMLGLPLIGSAADVGQFQAFLGFDFARFNPNSAYLPAFNTHGANGQFVYNFDKDIGVVVDVGAVTTGTLNHIKTDTTVLDFVVGPRFKYHAGSRFQPFVQMLFGGANASASTQAVLPAGAANFFPAASSTSLNPPVSLRLTTSRTGFAMMAGGGLDIRISRSIDFRPIEADYFLVRFPGSLTLNPQNVSNFRYSAGLNFTFGQR